MDPSQKAETWQQLACDMFDLRADAMRIAIDEGYEDILSKKAYVNLEKLVVAIDSFRTQARQEQARQKVGNTRLWFPWED